MSKIWRSETYFSTIIVNKDQVDSMENAQFKAYDGIRYKRTKTKIASNLADFTTTALSLLFKNTSRFTIAGALFSMWSDLSHSEWYYRKESIYGGFVALRDIINQWSSSFIQIEVEFAFIEDELRNGQKVRYIMDNGYDILD